MTQQQVDVVVVGGGPAGLAAAVALARSRRSVVVVDAGRPRNGPATGAHNVLGQEGVAPLELLARGRDELAGYGGQVLDSEVSAVERTADGVTVTVGGQELAARRLVVTTGLVDELPDVPGLAERWGRDVLHCPFCHGWEVRHDAVGILATGPMAAHQAQLFRALTPDVTLFTHTGPALSDEDAETLAALGVRVVAGEVVGLEVSSADADGDALSGVRLADGSVVARQALVVAPRFVARSVLLESLGLEVEDVLIGEHVVAQRVPADPRGATSVPGVWVAGNVTDPMAQVVVAAGQGLVAGAAVHGDLVAEDGRRAVQRRRESADFFDRASWEERYGAGDTIWSGRPNPQLVTEAAELAPGTALDVGCGEGADALWLAERGWTVTGADISGTALARAGAEADRRGLTVDWQEVDLGTWDAGVARYDLVSAQYFHWTPGPRAALFARLARAVRPGGTLLVVGHLFDDPAQMPRADMADMVYTPEEVAASLDPTQWEVLVSDLRPRTRPAHAGSGGDHGHGHPGDEHGAEHGDDHGGGHVSVPDAVLRARRR